MYKIIIITHGNLSDGFLSAVELIAGKQENVETFNIFVDTNIEEIEETMFKSILDSNEKKQEVVVLSDLLFGTPFNIATRLYEKCSFRHFTGINLAIVLELMLSRGASKLSDVLDDLEDKARKSFKNFEKMFEEVNNGEEHFGNEN